MRKSLKVLTILIAAVALVVAVSFSFSRATTTRAASCTPTGFIRDSIDLTAAMINPPTVNGKVTRLVAILVSITLQDSLAK